MCPRHMVCMVTRVSSKNKTSGTFVLIPRTCLQILSQAIGDSVSVFSDRQVGRGMSVIQLRVENHTSHMANFCFLQSLPQFVSHLVYPFFLKKNKTPEITRAFKKVEFLAPGSTRRTQVSVMLTALGLTFILPSLFSSLSRGLSTKPGSDIRFSPFHRFSTVMMVNQFFPP